MEGKRIGLEFSFEEGLGSSSSQSQNMLQADRFLLVLSIGRSNWLRLDSHVSFFLRKQCQICRDSSGLESRTFQPEFFYNCHCQWGPTKGKFPRPCLQVILPK